MELMVLKEILDGAQGATGNQGPPGPQGPKGNAGPKGDQVKLLRNYLLNNRF